MSAYHGLVTGLSISGFSTCLHYILSSFQQPYKDSIKLSILQIRKLRLRVVK